MNVAKIYLEFTGREGGHHFNTLHPSNADKFQPFAYVAWLPASNVVPAVTYEPNGLTDSAIVRFDVLDFEGTKVPPSHVGLFNNPEKHVLTMVRQAGLHWGPFTSKPYCRKLIPAVMSLDASERQSFMISMGQTPKRLRTATALLFCCARIDVWGSQEFTYKQAARDAVEHKIKLTAEAIRKYAQRGLIPRLKSDPLK